MSLLKTDPWENGVYTYPGTDILINSANIRNQAALSEYETGIVAMAHLDVGGVKGNFGAKHLCRIHKHLFGDVYPWAGRLRNVNIYKADSAFYDWQSLKSGIAAWQTVIRREGYLYRKLDMTETANRLTRYFAILNELHPFRDGNGRVIRVVLAMLAENAGYELHFPDITANDWTEASRSCQRKVYHAMFRIIKSGLHRKGGWDYESDGAGIETESNPE